MKKIKVLIVDDHELIRQSWKVLLSLNENIEVVADTGSGKEAIELIKVHMPDIVTMDINLPDISGIDTTEMIRKFSINCKILCISMHNNYAYAKKIMQKGANGYLTKNDSMQEFMMAITEVHEGRKYISEEIKTMLADQMLYDGDKPPSIHLLSGRELEVVELIKTGQTSKEIAEKLYVSVKTVEVHRYNILKKLGLRNSAALVNFMNQQMVA